MGILNSKDDRIAKLESDIIWMGTEIARLEAQYNELIMAVEKKHPDETRHETALRYITQRESECHGPEAAIKGE